MWWTKWWPSYSWGRLMERRKGADGLTAQERSERQSLDPGLTWRQQLERALHARTPADLVTLGPLVNPIPGAIQIHFESLPTLLAFDDAWHSLGRPEDSAVMHFDVPAGMMALINHWSLRVSYDGHDWAINEPLMYCRLALGGNDVAVAAPGVVAAFTPREPFNNVYPPDSHRGGSPNLQLVLYSGQRIVPLLYSLSAGSPVTAPRTAKVQLEVSGWAWIDEVSDRGA